MAARSAAGDLCAQPWDPLERAGGVRCAGGYRLERLGDSGQTEDARPALPRAFAREVAGDARGLSYSAHPAWEDDERPRPEGRTVRSQSGVGERQVEGVRSIEPGAEVAADEQGPRRCGEAAAALGDL